MRRVGLFAAVLISALLLALTGSASADTITYGNFSNLGAFTLNGVTPTINPGGVGVVDTYGRHVLRLTNNLSQSGGAFLTNPILLEDAGGFQASFSTAFSFRISDQQNGGADGIVFVVQTVASNVGGSGGGIGYAGISHSVGIEFDNWDNAGGDGYSDSHLGIDLNGNVSSVARQNVIPNLDSRPANDWFAWVDYDGDNDLLEVRLNTVNVRPAAASLGYTVDLVSVLGQSSAYIGFTSGTGAAGADHDIVDWQFKNTFAPIEQISTVPLPPGLWTGLGLLGLVGAVRRYRRRRAA